MTQGLDRRLRFVGRSRKKEPLPPLKQQAYRLSLWTGAYMLDSWEVGLLVVLCAGAALLAYSRFVSAHSAANVGGGPLGMDALFMPRLRCVACGWRG